MYCVNIWPYNVPLMDFVVQEIAHFHQPLREGVSVSKYCVNRDLDLTKV